MALEKANDGELVSSVFSKTTELLLESNDLEYELDPPELKDCIPYSILTASEYLVVAAQLLCPNWHRYLST